MMHFEYCPILGAKYFFYDMPETKRNILVDIRLHR